MQEVHRARVTFVRFVFRVAATTSGLTWAEPNRDSQTLTDGDALNRTAQADAGQGDRDETDRARLRQFKTNLYRLRQTEAYSN